MRNIKLTIQFDGGGFHGWQTQSCNTTVQKTVQDSLAMVLNNPVKLHGSGRTDAGVHALGQTANFNTDNPIPLQNLKKGLNSLLKGKIVILNAEECAHDFHARFSAKSRIYWYFILNQPETSPFLNRYSWHIAQSLDSLAMKTAAQYILGIHDFSSFQGADKKFVNPVREVYGIRIKKFKKTIILFEIHANSFLKHMVRNITGTLSEVGRGNIPAEDMKVILEKKSRKNAGICAPPHGLFLKEVRY